MRLLHKPLILCIITLLYCGCTNSTKCDMRQFHTVYTPQYAECFEILGTKNMHSTILHVRNPWQKADNVDINIFLRRNGESVPDGFDGEVVTMPLHRAALMSSSYVAFFDALGCTDRITAVSGGNYISNPTVHKLYAEGKIGEMGYDSNIDYETLAAHSTDAVLMYALSSENSGTTAKLSELGIPYIYIGDYVERTPLGKAEWVVAIAELCDCRAKGETVAQRVIDNYCRLRDSVATSDMSRPRVMLNTPYRDSWFMPSSNSYMVRLIEDAGAEYIYRNPTQNSSTVISTEEALVLCDRADYWLNTGSAHSLAELRREVPKFADISAVRNARVYNNIRLSAEAGSDFWESGALRADLVLQDLINILQHDAPTDSLTYYTRLR